MGRGRTSKLMMTKLDRAGRTVGPDELVVEEPLEIRLDDRLVTTTMRTPGNDYELAAGFCFTEGLLEGAPVREVRYCATGTAMETGFNVVTVSSGGLAPPATARLRPTTSSCGICGSASLADLRERLERRARPGPVHVEVLLGVATAARAAQVLFDATGAIHAAAAFDPVTGALAVVREDIGRHNAVDKVVGHLLLSGRVPVDGDGLFVSGRASFEIVQKAWAAGFGLIAAVSAPSSLAVETARAANISLVGFLRGGACNLYSPDPVACGS